MACFILRVVETQVLITFVCCGEVGNVVCMDGIGARWRRWARSRGSISGTRGGRGIPASCSLTSSWWALVPASSTIVLSMYLCSSSSSSLSPCSSSSSPTCHDHQAYFVCEHVVHVETSKPARHHPHRCPRGCCPPSPVKEAEREVKEIEGQGQEAWRAVSYTHANPLTTVRPGCARCMGTPVGTALARGLTILLHVSHPVVYLGTNPCHR